MITKTLLEFYQETSVDGFFSDKGTSHDYIAAYYSPLFTPLQFENIKLLEIGYQEGRSLRLWRNYFPNAELWTAEYNNDPNLTLVPEISYLWGDAYTQDILDKVEDSYFDFIIDDGPHTLNSQVYAIKNWTKKLKSGGRLIIEDLQDPAYLDTLHAEAENIGESSRTVDMRANKHRYDDIIFEIIKK